MYSNFGGLLSVAISIHKVLSNLQILLQSSCLFIPLQSPGLTSNFFANTAQLYQYSPSFALSAPPHTPLLPTPLCCIFYISDYESAQIRDAPGRAIPVPPLVRHMLCVTTVFVLLFIFTRQFWRENISLLLRTKLYLESSNRLHVLNFSGNKF